MNKLDKSETLETLYNRYGHTVYGVVLKLTSNVGVSEKILCEVFSDIDLNKINDQGNISVCSLLVSKAIQIVQRENAEIKIKLCSLEKEKYLSEIFFRTKSLDDLCNEHQQSREELFRKVRNELQAVAQRA